MGFAYENRVHFGIYIKQGYFLFVKVRLLWSEADLVKRLYLQPCFLDLDILYAKFISFSTSSYI